MPAHSPPSPQMHPAKRHRASSPDRDSPASINNPATAGPSPVTSEPQDGPGNPVIVRQDSGASQRVGQSSSFRNVSACNRCRLRKNRCDQKLPSCASCEKANVACVGYDPITKKEIPRSYVFYLETRVEQLEALLRANNIPYPPADNLEHCSRVGPDSTSVRSPAEVAPPAPIENIDGTTAVGTNSERSDEAKLHRLVSKSDITHGKEGTANPRYLGSTSGVSFARVVFAAVQSSVSENKSTSDKAGVRPSKLPMGGSSTAGATTMRDSFFGLHTKPTIHPARFPDKDVGTALVNLYFEHANPQIPILHRVEFNRMFEQAYDSVNPQRGPRELYMLNMVFAIGSGIIMGAMATKSEPQNSAAKPGEGRMSAKQAQPEEYHASAIVHLEACLNNSGGGLEELQAVLLLANFALLRPVPPGLWYIVGVAVRLAVDLGLHYEDGKDVDSGLRELSGPPNETQLRERGRREFIRDLRRRLWWSTYSLDRLVSICVGRPFGISDQVITTEFPSVLEDALITPEGFQDPPLDLAGQPTYKLVAHHYFRLRLLQSEILQVLQYQQAQSARASGQNIKNPYMHTSLPSPFLSRFDSFRAWRIDIDKRLYEWKMTAPTKQHTGVGFSTEFLDLNYWQAIVMLYRQSLSVPAMFEGEYNTSMDIKTRTLPSTELREDEDRVYLKVAEAGQKIMRLYRQLHLAGVLNYTYLATHHIFMAGISYLYAIWHSPIVRSRLSMDEVDFTVLAATSVFTDLSEKCPPAEACRDAIDRTARATIRMANSTGGFGQVLPPRPSTGSRGSMAEHQDWASRADSSSNRGHRPSHPAQRPSHHHQQQQQQQQQHSHHDNYVNVSASPRLPPIQPPAGPYRMNSLPNIKAEHDSFSMMRHNQGQPRSNASAPEGADSPDTTAIDPSLLPSPSAMRSPAGGAMGSPRGMPPSSSSPAGAAGLGPGGLNRGSAAAQLPPNVTAAQNMAAFLAASQQQQQQQQQQNPFSPGSAGQPGQVNFNDLAAMGLLNDASGRGGAGAGGEMDDSENVDLGFGLGWEGLHHDFSDGQQYDLFDGFFFGGQQGGGGMGGMGGSNGVM